MAEPQGVMDAEDMLQKLPPERLPDGTPNIEHFREWYRIILEMEFRFLAAGRNVPTGLDHIRKAANDRCAAFGLDPRHLADTRTEKEKVADAIRMLTDMENGEEILELSSDLVEGMRREMLIAAETMQEQISEQKDKAKAKHRKGRGAEGKALTLQKWTDLLERVKEVQTWARKPVPLTKRQLDAEGMDPEAWEASQTIRFQLYVGRSQDAAKKTKRPSDALFIIEPHLVEMARALWEARRNIMYYYDPSKDMEEIVHSYHACGRPGWEKLHPYEGVMFCVPPGHGKSDFVQHAVGLMVIENPYEQVKFIHAAEDEASDMMVYVTNLFDEKQPAGRRTRALFPDIPHPRRANTKEMRLDVKHRLKSPTLAAHGVKAARSGANASLLVFDDVVDQKEANEETTRQETLKRINATWMRRLRPGGFHISVFTLWHPDDANANRMMRALRDEVKVRVCRIPTGGPEPATDVNGRHRPKFDPVAPKRWPAKKINAIFRETNDPVLFAAQFQCDPRSISARIIKRIRLYDPFDRNQSHLPVSERTHTRFLASCVRHLSIDPAATNREKSDKAGVVYLGHGTVYWTEQGGVQREEVRARILDAFQIRATQHEIVEYAGEYARNNPVDYVYFETRSGFQASGDEWERRYGVSAIRCDPTNEKKALRLKAVASLLEDINAKYGVRAVVEFPGVWDDEKGYLVPRPDIAWLVEQIINFGITKEEHAVDAMVQVLRRIDLGVGSGEITRAVMRAEPRSGCDPRMVEEFKRMRQQQQSRLPEEEEAEWARTAWN